MSAATTFGALAPGARFRLLPAGPVWCKVNGLARDYAGPMPDPRMTGYSLSDDRKVYPVDDAEYLEHLRLAEPSPSPAARRWAERIDSGTFEHGHVRSFAGLVARMAEGLPYRGDGGVGGCRAHPTTLREHEAVELVRLLAERPVGIPDELTVTGLRWLRTYAGERLPGFPVERLADFERFTYAGEHAPSSGWHSVPVWRAHFADGGPFLTYAVTSARTLALCGNPGVHPGNWTEGAW